jgi:hypothetical protein
MELVVQRAEIQPYQWHAEAGGDRLGQHRLAAALHAQQQHAARRVQRVATAGGGGIAADEHAAAQFDPALQPARSGDVVHARAVEFVMQVAAAVEQFELEPCQLRQVAGIECAVVVDQLARDAAHVDRIQAAQVAHDLLHGFTIDFDAAPAVLAGIALGLSRTIFRRAPASGSCGA